MKSNQLQLLISKEEIAQEIARAACAIDAQYAGEELTIVMVMKGAICIVADLMRALKTPCSIEYCSASSYGRRGTERGELRVSGLDLLDLKDKNVLLVDDIFDSGATLTHILLELQAKMPKSLKSLVLLSKNVPRANGCKPDYVLFEIENLFVIGFGLDYKEQYRGLPGIYIFTGSV